MQARDDGATGVDRAVEGLGRWTAARSTRRSFLGRLGRAGVLLAAGPSSALILAGEAEAAARVCGQTGTAPLCPTFDCGATWGWCWYATGCCADGALKKICDCCAPNTPHAVGYCPPGTRVHCIVESCGADPRLQTRQLTHIPAEHAAAVAVEVCKHRFAGPVPMAVLGDAESPSFAAAATSLGGIVAGPVLLTARGGLLDIVRAELSRLRVEHVVVAGSHLAPAVDAALAGQGIRIWRVGESHDLATFTSEVAAWSRSMTGRRSVVAVVPGPAEAAVSAAAALAHSRRLPLVVAGPGAAALLEPRPVHETTVVTTDASAAARYPGGRALAAPDGPGLAAQLATAAFGDPGEVVTLAPRQMAGAAAGAATWPAPLLLFAANTMDGAWGALLRLRARVRRAVVAAPFTAFGNRARYELQAVLNEYETHQLRGGDGDGLPVITQPPEERPIGRARR